MKKADRPTAESEVNGMTDKQFLHHLIELLEVAKSSANLGEFIKKLENMISQYNQ